MSCTTHHHACDCREAAVSELVRMALGAYNILTSDGAHPRFRKLLLRAIRGVCPEPKLDAMRSQDPEGQTLFPFVEDSI